MRKTLSEKENECREKKKKEEEEEEIGKKETKRKTK